MLPPAAVPEVVLLVGGEAEDDGGWSDAPYAAFAAGRRVAILGTSESDEPGWYSAYFTRLGATQADEFVLATREDALSADLTGYDAFFLRGGDQWEYISLWDGTPVEDAILAAAAVGGTSAGAAVLGGVDYTAENGTVYPEEVLADWASPYVTLSDAFLPILPGVVTDTHFGQRGRLGRLVPFAACEGLIGIGVDDKTAAVLEGGTWTVYGTSTVSFVTGGTATCTAAPPTVDDARLDVLVDGWTWSEAEGPVGPGEARDAPYAAPSEDLLLSDGTEGTWTLLHARADDLYCGTLELSPGSSRIPGIVTDDAWDEDLVEPRVAGTVWAVARAELPVGVLMPEGAEVTALADGGFEGGGTVASVVIAALAGEASEEVGWQDPACEGTRLARALTGARVSVVPPGGVTFAGLGWADAEDTGEGDGEDTAGEAAKDEGCGCGTGSVAGIVPSLIALLAVRRGARSLPVNALPKGEPASRVS